MKIEELIQEIVPKVGIRVFFMSAESLEHGVQFRSRGHWNRYLIYVISILNKLYITKLISLSDLSKAV
jgi:hypothetical protein